MKKIKVATSVLTSAQALQASYTRMKVAKTQNVRNPFPMHQLIQCVLPKHDDTQEKAIRQVLTGDLGRMMTAPFLGKKLARQFNKAVAEVKANAGMTITEVCDVLSSKGFLVNKFTVRTTLFSMVGNIGSFPMPAEQGKRGRGESLYFVRS